MQRTSWLCSSLQRRRHCSSVRRGQVCASDAWAKVRGWIEVAFYITRVAGNARPVLRRPHVLGLCTDPRRLSLALRATPPHPIAVSAYSAPLRGSGTVSTAKTSTACRAIAPSAVDWFGRTVRYSRSTIVAGVVVSGWYLPAYVDTLEAGLEVREVLCVAHALGVAAEREPVRIGPCHTTEPRPEYARHSSTRVLGALGVRQG